MRRDRADALAGLLLGGLLAWGVGRACGPIREGAAWGRVAELEGTGVSESGDPADREREAGRIRWLVRERGSNAWQALDARLADRGRWPWREGALDLGATRLQPRLQVRGAQAALVWPDGAARSLPFDGPLVCERPWSLAAFSGGEAGGALLLGSEAGVLALQARGRGEALLALGTVPGAVRRIAADEPGHRAARGWWVGLELEAEAAGSAWTPEAAPTRAALARIERSESAQLELRWLRSTGLAAGALLAPLLGDPRSERGGGQGVWVVGERRREAWRYDRAGRPGLRIGLPLSGARAAVATTGGGLLVAFPGALVEFDPRGHPTRSRGGFADLTDLRRVRTR